MAETAGIPPAEVLRKLSAYNEWWATGKVPDVLLKKFHRRDFYTVKENLNRNKITMLIGPRRVGKTVLIRQLVGDLISNGTPPTHILYAKMDDYTIKSIPNPKIEAILDTYSQNILGVPLGKLASPAYVFFDEMQSVENWKQQMMDVYEKHHNIVFLVSGSSSPAMFKDEKGVLTGRYREQLMLPMKFVDAINMHEQPDEMTLYDETGLALRKSLKAAIETGRAADFYKAVVRAFSSLAHYEKQIKIYLNEYLIKGGYPELYEKEKNLNWSECGETLFNQLEAILSKDIVEVFGVRNPSKVLDLFQLIGSQTAQIRKYSDMAQTLGIQKTDTLKDYISYLNQTYLIGIAELYSRNVDTTKKSNKKLYVMDVGLRNVSLGVMLPKHADVDDMGKITETVMFDHCNRLKFNLNKALSAKPLYYWRQNGHEVDIVIPTETSPIPIEVKNRSKTDATGVGVFMEKYKSPFGFIVSRDRLELKGKIIYMPLWLFLIMC